MKYKKSNENLRHLEDVYSKLPNTVVAQVMTGIANDMDVANSTGDCPGTVFTESQIKKYAFRMAIKKASCKTKRTPQKRLLSFRT